MYIMRYVWLNFGLCFAFKSTYFSSQSITWAWWFDLVNNVRSGWYFWFHNRKLGCVPKQISIKAWFILATSPAISSIRCESRKSFPHPLKKVCELYQYVVYTCIFCPSLCQRAILTLDNLVRRHRLSKEFYILSRVKIATTVHKKYPLYGREEIHVEYKIARLIPLHLQKPLKIACSRRCSLFDEDSVGALTRNKTCFFLIVCIFCTLFWKRQYRKKYMNNTTTNDSMRCPDKMCL